LLCQRPPSPYIKHLKRNLPISAGTSLPYLTVDQKMAVSSALACATPTTNQQQKPPPEPKKDDSTINAERRSSRANIPSSSNLKIFFDLLLKRDITIFFLLFSA
jgi:hypothetical protein